MYTFRQNDTAGSIALTVANGLETDIATAAAVFEVATAANTLLFDDGVATIGTVTSAPDGSKGATFTFAMNATATATADTLYYGAFKVTYPSGKVERLPKDHYIAYWVTKDFSALDATPAATVTAGFLESQAAHGLAVKNLVYHGASGWAKAKADAATTLAAGIVVSVPDVNSFRVVYLGPQEVTLASHGLGSAGTSLYLSAATAGLATSTAPVTGFVQKIGQVKDANTLILWPHNAEVAA